MGLYNYSKIEVNRYYADGDWYPSNVYAGLYTQSSGLTVHNKFQLTEASYPGYARLPVNSNQFTFHTNPSSGTPTSVIARLDQILSFSFPNPTTGLNLFLVDRATPSGSDDTVIATNSLAYSNGTGTNTSIHISGVNLRFTTSLLNTGFPGVPNSDYISMSIHPSGAIKLAKHMLGIESLAGEFTYTLHDISGVSYGVQFGLGLSWDSGNRLLYFSDGLNIPTAASGYIFGVSLYDNSTIMGGITAIGDPLGYLDPCSTTWIYPDDAANTSNWRQPFANPPSGTIYNPNISLHPRVSFEVINV